MKNLHIQNKTCSEYQARRPADHLPSNPRNRVRPDNVSTGHNARRFLLFLDVFALHSPASTGGFFLSEVRNFSFIVPYAITDDCGSFGVTATETPSIS